jgi:hypothetical protein
MRLFVRVRSYVRAVAGWWSCLDGDTSLSKASGSGTSFVLRVCVRVSSSREATILVQDGTQSSSQSLSLRKIDIAHVVLDSRGSGCSCLGRERERE